MKTIFEIFFILNDHKFIKVSLANEFFMRFCVMLNCRNFKIDNIKISDIVIMLEKARYRKVT